MTQPKSLPGRPLVPRWLAVMIAASLAVVVFGLMAPELPENPKDPQIAAEPVLVDCLWLDRLPEDPYEPFNLYIFSEEGGRVGINARAESAFKILIEVFEFIDANGRIQFYFPHDRRKPNSAYAVEKMKKPTSYFDWTLTLDSDPQNGGKKAVYYTGPEFRDGALGTVPAENLRGWVLERLERAKGR